MILLGCSTSDNPKDTDTPTSGLIRIAVDESLKPLIDAEIKAFEGIYRSASVKAVYVSEAEAVRLLVSDCVRLAVITRGLTAVEATQIKAQKITPHESKVAREAVALIVNSGSTDTAWDMTKLKNVMRNQKVIFDNQNSGIARYIRDSLLHAAHMPANSFAVESNEAVVDYVKKDPNAVGIIGSSWISDSDDSVANRFLGSIKVVAIENDGDHYQPYQAYIARKLYPLTRDVVINSREARSGLGTGFTSFVAGDKGQRIVLKAGLVPFTMPVRLVEISREIL
jgi:phosphate transport system substrate-binding protein